MMKTAALMTSSLLLMLPLFAHADAASCPDALNHTVRELNGNKEVNLCDEYGGKVVLIVNTASKCGFTPQFEGLEKLYRDHKDEGFVVLGFPSNDFAGQEPGTEAQIQEFCTLTYGVEFPMFSKVHAAEDKASPLYQDLAAMAGGEYPGWNFHKYLIGRDGELVGSYRSRVRPESEELLSAIEASLAR